MREIDQIYYDLCCMLNRYGKDVAGTKELTNVKIQLKDITQNIVSIRNISPAYLFGEWLWYFTGRNSVKFISSFGSMWSKLTDDGKTNNSAYGYRMKYEFGFNQIETIIALLRKDPDSRRAVINLNVPNKNVIETKDEPCTIALQFLIRNDKLHCTAMMRSNDIWYGFPYDVAFFTELQMYIADRLQIGYGTYTHFDVSLHMYEKDFESIDKIIENPESQEIFYDRKKFHKNSNFIGSLIEVASEHCSREEIQALTLKFAEEFFDFKMGEKHSAKDKFYWFKTGDKYEN